MLTVRYLKIDKIHDNNIIIVIIMLQFEDALEVIPA